MRASGPVRGRIISEKQAGRTKGRVPVAGKPGADISTRREDPAVGEGIAAQFRDTGVVRVSGAFSPSVAEEMRAAVYRYAQGKIGLRLDDPSTWPTGWLPISWKGLRRSPQFDAVSSNDPVRAALDAIFGAGGWRHPRPGAQILLTLPKAGPWVLPDAWHMDCGFERATWPVFAVKMFAFFGEVPPMGGGTVVLSGTHRLVERYRRELPPGTGGGMTNWRRFLKQDPWLAGLLKGGAMPDGGRHLVGQRHEVDGVPVEVVELVGRPGDVVITHLYVFHAASPNTSDRPRYMLGKEIRAQSEDPAE